MGLQPVRSSRVVLPLLSDIGISFSTCYHPIRIVKGQDTSRWRHEYFKQGCPQLISKITRTCVKVKGRRTSEAAAKTPEAEAPVQAHSDDSLEGEGASDYNKNDSVHYLDYSGRYIARQVSDNSYFAPAEIIKDEFDEKVSSMFSVRPQSRSRSIGIGFADLDEMRLEPLPIDSIGILDSPCSRNKNDLDEFGQLLGRLI